VGVRGGSEGCVFFLDDAEVGEVFLGCAREDGVQVGEGALDNFIFGERHPLVCSAYDDVSVSAFFAEEDPVYFVIEAGGVGEFGERAIEPEMYAEDGAVDEEFGWGDDVGNCLQRWREDARPNGSG